PGTQHGAAVAEEHADAALLAGPGEEGCAGVGKLLRGLEVVFDGRDGLVVRYVEVVVEVASVRGVPRESPAHPLPERLDLADRRPGHRRERGVAGVQMGQVTDAVGLVGADRAALVPGRVEHEVLHDELSPAWDEGCPVCSYQADSIGDLSHLHARNTTFAAVSRAPISKIEPFRQRMGWTFPWYSSYGSDFNYDFHVTNDETVAPIEYNFQTAQELADSGAPFFARPGEQGGVSVFFRDGGTVLRTW